MEGFIAVCATAKRGEALVPNKRANNGLAGDTYANEGVPRESILGCAHNISPSLQKASIFKWVLRYCLLHQNILTLLDEVAAQVFASLNMY